MFSELQELRLLNLELGGEIRGQLVLLTLSIAHFSLKFLTTCLGLMAVYYYIYIPWFNGSCSPANSTPPPSQGGRINNAVHSRV